MINIYIYIYILFAQTVSDIDRHSLQPVAYDVKLIVIAGSSWAGSSTEWCTQEKGEKRETQEGQKRQEE